MNSSSSTDSKTMIPTEHQSEDIQALSALTAISAIDGRYRHQVAQLAADTSEFGLLKFRVQVEIEWFIALSEHPEIKELPVLDAADLGFLRTVVSEFGLQDAQSIKDIEATTNHDVKAVEYFVKSILEQRPKLAPHIEFVHFCCTSEDINNMAYALMVKSARESALEGVMDELITTLRREAHKAADAPMLSRTHGQAASPTTMGKELANVVARLQRQLDQFRSISVLGKFNGAVGNYNAHHVAYPNVDWPSLTANFVNSLGLSHNPYTTQIEPHDYLAEYFHSLMRFNQILLDFNRDIWAYISIGYFKQRKVEGETGSSTMPHKVNPIDFENSEGNLGIANAMLDHLALKLPVSRWQRDLSDSTVLRSVGTALAHSLLAWRACLRGISKLELSRDALRQDLDQSWEVLGEAVQTVMRKHGMKEPYEALKAATRGRQLDEKTYADVLNQLSLPAQAHQELAGLRPSTYLGYAEPLADI